MLRDNCSKQIIKPWTVLIYANGNNDLEPEISKSLLDIESVGTVGNINVIVQLARAPYTLVKSIRPCGLGPTEIDRDWSGVRRYLVNEDSSTEQTREFKSKLLEDLTNINMADPSTLKDFICWGIKNFPAECFMLILAGHGAGFMGILPDYTLQCPQIMSINGANIAIHKAVEETGSKIDILLLDSCYMNMIESVYELGIGSKSPNYIMTPDISPIEGLPYDVIMKVFRDISEKNDTKTVIKNLVYEVNKILNKKRSNLLVFRLNSVLLRCIKILISGISKSMIKNNIDLKKYTAVSYGEFPSIDLYYLTKVLKNVTNDSATLINIRMLTTCIKSIILTWDEEESEVCNNSSLYLFIPNNDYAEIVKKYYSKMQFTHNNKWMHYFIGKNEDYKFNTVCFKYVLPTSENMPLEGIMNVIMCHNPGLSQYALNRIIEELGWTHCVRLKNQKRKESY